MLNEHVRNIMTTNPIVVTPNQTIAQVKSLMNDKKKQQLPVVEEGKLVGMITSYDLWQHSETANAHAEQKVHEIMSRRIIKICLLYTSPSPRDA